MKKTIFILFLFFAVDVHARQIILEVPDSDIKIVEHDILDAETWIREMWENKVGKCKKRLVQQEVERSVKEADSLPAGEDAIVEKAFERKDYMSRKDAEEKDAKEKEAKQGAEGSVKTP